MKQSGKVALGGILGAIALICLMGTVFPYAVYALPALAGLALTPIVMEAGVKWGWLVFGAVAILNLFLTPSLEARFMFVAFLGYYPVLRASVEKRSAWIRWIIKLAVFNAAMVAVFWLMLKVGGIESDALELFGVNLPLVFLLIGNAVFVIYDLALANINFMYMKFLHPQIARIFHI